MILQYDTNNSAVCFMKNKIYIPNLNTIELVKTNVAIFHKFNNISIFKFCIVYELDLL